jgi:hypothetical protein
MRQMPCHRRHCRCSCLCRSAESRLAFLRGRRKTLKSEFDPTVVPKNSATPLFNELVGIALSVHRCFEPARHEIRKILMASWCVFVACQTVPSRWGGQSSQNRPKRAHHRQTRRHNVFSSQSLTRRDVRSDDAVHRPGGSPQSCLHSLVGSAVCPACPSEDSSAYGSDDNNR